LLALASLNHACQDHVLTFPQRSPPWLLTTAACGGLRSAPDCRTRRALLHLSYSYAPPNSGGTRDTRPDADVQQPLETIHKPCCYPATVTSNITTPSARRGVVGDRRELKSLSARPSAIRCPPAARVPSEVGLKSQNADTALIPGSGVGSISFSSAASTFRVVRSADRTG